jgi:hypothetical protein
MGLGVFACPLWPMNITNENIRSKRITCFRVFSFLDLLFIYCYKVSQEKGKFKKMITLEKGKQFFF